MRRSLPLLTCALAIVVALAAPAAAKDPVFKTGTFAGSASVGGAVKIKIYKGTCRKKFLNSIEVKGYCFAVKSFPILASPCPDGQTKMSRPWTSGFAKVDVALKATGKNAGKHSSQIVTGSQGISGTVARRTLELKAKGSKITGTATWQDTSVYDSDLATPLNCRKTVATFTARR